jgi:hypothetical protein
MLVLLLLHHDIIRHSHKLESLARESTVPPSLRDNVYRVFGLIILLCHISCR